MRNCNYIYYIFYFFVILSFKVATPYHVILCNFRSLFYFIYISVNSWHLNKPDEDWYWPVEISQLNSISRCLISPCKSLLDCNVFNFIYFDWSRSFWIRRWKRLFVHGFCSGFFTLTKHCIKIFMRFLHFFFIFHQKLGTSTHRTSSDTRIQ